jgi:pimeloyl-ACP methyl ester carboxylesterase
MGPSATVEILAGAGHFPWLECPGALRASLDRLARPPRS